MNIADVLIMVAVIGAAVSLVGAVLAVLEHGRASGAEEPSFAAASHGAGAARADEDLGLFTEADDPC